jgi:RNA polymerase sigma-70 factor (ECF subfamily)
LVKGNSVTDLSDGLKRPTAWGANRAVNQTCPSDATVMLCGVTVKEPSVVGRWNERQIAEGRHFSQTAMARAHTGPYVLQAAIADLHLHQSRDWAQIASLYETLARQTGSAIVEMNRAIAIAEIHGPEAGLAILDTLELGHYRYFHSTHAELLRRAGRHSDARRAYQRALNLAQTDPERRFLRDRLAELRPCD